MPTEEAYFAHALALFRERDRLAESVRGLDSTGLQLALADARRACGVYLVERVPVTLQRRIRELLRKAGAEPDV